MSSQECGYYYMCGTAPRSGILNSMMNTHLRSKTFTTFFVFFSNKLTKAVCPREALKGRIKTYPTVSIIIHVGNVMLMIILQKYTKFISKALSL